MASVQSVESHARSGRAMRAVGFTEHLLFFDTDHDRRISLRETQRGLTRLGLGHLVTLPGALFIHAGVAGLGLLRANFQSPAHLSLPEVGFVRHPDTDLVDREGQFDAARLSSVFAQYGRTFSGEALTLPELLGMTTGRVIERGTRDAKDLLLLPGGIAAAALEWVALWWMAGEFREGKRVLSQQTVLRFYTDSHFFNDVARHVTLEREARSERLLGRVRNFVQTWLA
ncbi:MAG TPA: caleosin family protein [Polyangiales bacterium]